VNKWDLIKEKTTDKEKLKAVLQQIEAELFFISYAPVLLLSAKTGEALDRLFKNIEKVRTGAKQRVTTGVLNRVIAEAMTAHPPAARSGKRLKILYGTQPEPKRFCSISIPEIVFFANDGSLLDESYHRYLENQIRQHVPYVGLPMKFHFRSREKRSQK
jgi:GTP-binding protein